VIWLVQLVFDAADPDALMQFWGQALGYRNALIGVSQEEIVEFRTTNPQFDGRGRIDDDDLRRMPVYIQRVPEPKTGRNRVRLEVATPDVHGTASRLEQLGAAQAAEGELVDVEGNEFALVVGDGEVRLASVVIDAIDPERLLAFWAEATGYRRDGARSRCDPEPLGLRWTGDHFERDGRGLRHISGAGGAVGPAPFDLTPGLRFVATTDPKRTKNRLHVDLCSDEPEADRDRLVRLGAEVVQWDTDHVLNDPEGNEFCLGGRPVATAG
jgi:predicted enzyme related to lactoylglutathione lyase